MVLAVCEQRSGIKGMGPEAVIPAVRNPPLVREEESRNAFGT
jgi:hypothetical protein